MPPSRLLYSYPDEFKELLTPTTVEPDNDEDAGTGMWVIRLLPYIEQQALFDQWDFTYFPGKNSGSGSGYGIIFSHQTPTAQQTRVSMFFCPSRRTMNTAPLLSSGATPGALGDYACNLGTTAYDTFHQGIATPADGPFQLGERGVGVAYTHISDGLSSTILIGDKHIPLGKLGQNPWDNAFYNGDDLPSWGRGWVTGIVTSVRDVSATSSLMFGSYHTGSCQFVFADGSVRNLSVNTDPAVFTLMLSIADGQVIADFN